MTTAPPDTLLFAFWTGILAGFCYLWATMLMAWIAHRDSRSLVYVILFVQLSCIAGINAVIRGDLFGLDTNALVAIQRGIWGAVVITSWAIMDIYNAEHRGKSPKAMRWWLRITRHELGGIK